MTQIKYVSVHEREGGERRIMTGKKRREHETLSIPKPNNDLDEFQRHEWTRVGVFELPEPMPKSEFPEWWNENLRADDEPEVIDRVLRKMGER